MMSVIDIYNVPGKKYYFPFPCNETHDCHPIQLHIYKGTYLFELWGAGRYSSGGYVRGEIHLYDEKTQFLLYIGGASPIDSDKCGLGGYNGGGYSAVIGETGSGAHVTCRSIGGNGATDIRLNETLQSRIIVAAGSGGGSIRVPGGFGGGFIGGDGNLSSKESSATKFQGFGGTQSNGGSGWRKGEFGIGGNITSSVSTDLSTGGGGGWFGGGSGYHNDLFSTGGGGSSYINGNPECVITSEKYKFENSITLSGNETMPLPKKDKSTGTNIGNGYAIITCIDPIITCKQNDLSFHFESFISIFIISFIHK